MSDLVYVAVPAVTGCKNKCGLILHKHSLTRYFQSKVIANTERFHSSRGVICFPTKSCYLAEEFHLTAHCGCPLLTLLISATFKIDSLHKNAEINHFLVLELYF